MFKPLPLVFILSSVILLSGCTQAEIETNVKDASNAAGRVLRGAGEGLMEGLSGDEEER